MEATSRSIQNRASVRRGRAVGWEQLKLEGCGFKTPGSDRVEFCESSIFWKAMVNNLWCDEVRSSARAHVRLHSSLAGNPQFFWSPLSSWWGTEVGINCTSKRLTHPLPPPYSWCLLRSQAAVFVLTLKFIPQSDSSFESISIRNAPTHKDETVGNLYSGSSYMYFRQPYIEP